MPNISDAEAATKIRAVTEEFRNKLHAIVFEAGEEDEDGCVSEIAEAVGHIMTSVDASVDVYLD